MARRKLAMALIVTVIVSIVVQSDSFRNDTARYSTGFWISFSRPVRITRLDENFPHQYPSGSSTDFRFEGWPLRPGGSISISWFPSTERPVSYGWLTEPTSASAPEGGLIDDFNDGNIYSVLGLRWETGTFFGGEFRIPLMAKCDTDGCYAVLSKLATPGMTSMGQHFDSPIDATEFDGLYLRLASSEPVAVNVELMCKDPNCENGYKFTWVGESAHVSSEVQEFRMDFARFVSDPGECPSTERLLDASRIQNLGIYLLQDRMEICMSTRLASTLRATPRHSVLSRWESRRM